MIPKYDLSVIITSRKEEFLSRTVDGVLEARRGKTEVIVVLDGAWSEPQLKDHEDVTIIYHKESIGQRAAINEAVRVSESKYVMKLDAHCIMDEGFDVKLMADCEYNWTVVPRLYNLHVFDWKCKKCGNMWYQGPTPKHCFEPGESRKRNNSCDSKEFEKIMVWAPRRHRKSDHMKFDPNLKFGYWGSFKNRPEGKEDVSICLGLLGACFFLHRKRYLEIGLNDEKLGSWGTQGSETALKSWLSGGELRVNKKTWYSHMFRTQGGDFGFPYKQSGNQIARAKKMVQDTFLNNKWDKQTRPLSWLIEKFWPIPGWKDSDLKRIKEADKRFNNEPTKGIIYYTDNQLNLKIAHRCKKQIKRIGLPIVSCSLKPMDNMGKNIHLKLKRGYLTYFKQILTALENSTADIIYFCEHDVMYHKTHFDFTPPKNDVYYYNTNFWRTRVSDGHSVHYDTEQVNMICGYRELLLKHYKKRLQMLENKIHEIEHYDDAKYFNSNDIGKRVKDTKEFNSYIRKMGFEPGTHNRAEKIDNYKAERYQSEYPNIDLRHGNNLTASRWKKEQFRSQRNCQGWKETTSDKIKGWDLSALAFK